MRAALKLAPDDATASVALAVVMLRQGDDQDRLVEAGRRLVRAGELLSSSGSYEQQADYLVVSALYFALNGEPQKAREQLQQVLERNPDSRAAAEALEALGK